MSKETPQSASQTPPPIQDLIEHDRMSNVSSIGRIEQDQVPNVASIGRMEQDRVSNVASVGRIEQDRVSNVASVGRIEQDRMSNVASVGRIEQDRVSNVASVGRLEQDRMSNVATNDQTRKGSTASFPMGMTSDQMQQDRPYLREALYNTIEREGSLYKAPINEEDLLLAKTKKMLIKTAPQNKRSRRHRLRNFLRKRICMLNWIGNYNIHWGVHDAIAGVTLGLTIIPESIACALLAGLPARYGLCSAFIGCFIYLIFGAIDKVIIGPASLLALVSIQFTIGKPIEFAIALTFLSGVVQLIMSA